MMDDFLHPSPNSPTPGSDVWFIHGWGDSASVFRGVLNSPLVERFRLFAPDLPGFGGHPPMPSTQSLEGIVSWLVLKIRATSNLRPIALVGHSIGGMIVTRIAEELEEQVRGVVSVEGNLIRSDAFYTRRALRYESGEKLRQDEELHSFFQSGNVHDSYIESFGSADPETLLKVGKSAAYESHRHRAGSRFRRLRCPKVYYWGTVSTDPKTAAFLLRHKLEQRSFEGCGHWLMLEREEEFLWALHQDLRRFFED